MCHASARGRGGAAGRLAVALSCRADDPVVSRRRNQHVDRRRAGDDQRADRGRDPTEGKLILKATWS